MAVHSIKAVQNIPVSLERAWNFFSDPANLPLITPESMSFRIISRHPGGEIYPGQIIEYTVAPLAGIRLYWMTEITQLGHRSAGNTGAAASGKGETVKFFIDEQRYGPYSMWHHQHHFREIEGGVEMTDLVHYKNPLGFWGELINPLIVRPKLRKIFEHRFTKVNELLGRWEGQQVELEIH